jgi:hypothetical protein
MESETIPDPLDKWTEPTEITEVSFSGTLNFSCCRKIHIIHGDHRSEVTCSRCGTVYGVALLIRLLSPEDYRFPIGTLVRPVEKFEVKVGSSLIILDPNCSYEATQDTHSSLNVPPHYQPIIVEVNGDHGKRRLIALVPEEKLELVEI